jgi:hypothetical protein
MRTKKPARLSPDRFSHRVLLAAAANAIDAAGATAMPAAAANANGATAAATELDLIDDGRRLSRVIDAVVAQRSSDSAACTGKADTGREQS